MGLYEYMLLSDEQQWDELWTNGQFITNLKSIDTKFSLYALHMFYVEVELDVLKYTIIDKHVFVHGHRMDKYAGEINLNTQ